MKGLMVEVSYIGDDDQQYALKTYLNKKAFGRIPGIPVPHFTEVDRKELDLDAPGVEAGRRWCQKAVDMIVDTMAKDEDARPTMDGSR